MAAVSSIDRASNRPNYATGLVRKLSDAEIQKLVERVKTPRQKELEGYQSFSDGTAYAGRPSFFTDDKPMQERKPCIEYPIVRMAIDSNAAFAMGEGRFPTILSLSSESDDAFDKDLGLSKTDSATFDSFNAKLIDLGWFQKAFREAYKMAQAAKSVALVCGFRSGLPFVDLVWSKLCTPTFGDPADPTRVTRLEIRYRYTDPWRDPIVTGGEYWLKVLEYLRVIDAKSDRTYRPKEIWDVTDPGISETERPQSEIKHGFGLCPVHWYARAKATSIGAGVDGRAVHEGICGLVEQSDLALSQRHRAAAYAGDPQTVLTGVSEDEHVGNVGRSARHILLPGDLDAKGNPGPWAKAFAGSAGQGTKLRRGAGEVWRIQAPEGKAAMLCLAGDALKALDDDARDVIQRTCDALGMTVVDSDMFGGAGDLSGRTLAFIFSKQINHVSEDREDLKRCLILPTLDLFYRMLLSEPKGVYLPGIDKVLPILKRMLKRASDGTEVWFSPMLRLKWGDYFEPSDLDEQTRVGTALAAYNDGDGIITLATAVEHVRSVFQIGSTDQYVKTLLEERAKKSADQQAQQAKQGAALHGAMAALNGPRQGGTNARTPKPGAGARSLGSIAKPGSSQTAKAG